VPPFISGIIWIAFFLCWGSYQKWQTVTRLILPSIGIDTLGVIPYNPASREDR